MSGFILSEEGYQPIYVGGLSSASAEYYERRARADGHETETMVPVPDDLSPAATAKIMSEMELVIVPVDELEANPAA